MLRLLTVLFLISYGLMVLLIEQNRTITSQRSVITVLMSEGKELTPLKGKLLNERRNAQKHPGSETQARAPSTQPVPQHNKDNTRPALLSIRRALSPTLPMRVAHCT